MADDLAGKSLMVNPQGQAVLIPTAMVQEAYKQGFRAETPEETNARIKQDTYGDTGGEVKAGLLGAGRALTLGASDVVLPSMGVVAKEDIAGYEEANPTATTVGEVGGTVGGLLIPGAAPAQLTKLGGRAAVGMGKWGARATKGFVEGVGYSLGDMISENAISDDHKLTGEKLFLANGAAGLVGAAMNVGMGAAGDVGEKLLDALGGPALMKKLLDSRNKRTLRALGVTPEEYQAADFAGAERQFGRPEKLGGILADEGNIPRLGESAAEVRATLDARRMAVGREMGNVLEDADRYGVSFDMKRAVEKMRVAVGEEVSDPVMAQFYSGANALLKQYEKKAAGSVTFAEAAQMKSKLQDYVRDFADMPIAKKAIASMGDALETEIDDQLGAALGADAAKAYQSLRERYSAYKLAEPAAKRSVSKEAVGAAEVGVATPGLGAVKNVGRGVAAGALGLGPASTLQRKYNALLASAADKLLKRGGTATVGKGVRGHFLRGLTNPAFGGAFRAQIERAVGGSIDDALSTHMDLADQHGQAYFDSIGVTPQADPDGHLTAEKLRHLQGVQAQAQAIDVALDADIKRLLGTQPGRAPSSRRSPLTQENFQKLSSTLDKLQTNPELLQKYLDTGKAASHAPTSAMEANFAATRAVQLLQATMPRPARYEPIKGLADKWAPTKADLTRWERYLDAVQNPHRVIQDVRSGTITAEQVQVLQQVYPSFYQDMKNKVLAELSARDTPLPHKYRYGLSLLTATSIGGAGDANRTQLIQKAHRSNMQPQGGSAPDGRQEVDTKKNLETQFQRIEGR